ncbi:MAG TPA: hypothetical protein PKK61_01085 [Defluviitaleaceae bacterium]|nr:hypothetical protein [Defluviitaleaceae bacterium]
MIIMLDLAIYVLIFILGYLIGNISLMVYYRKELKVLTKRIEEDDEVIIDPIILERMLDVD